MPRHSKLSAVLNQVEDTVIEESTIVVEDNAVDTYEKLGDNLNNALTQAEVEIARIDERAEIAISVVTQSIRTQAIVAKGKVLLEIRDKYSHIPDFTKSLASFSDRIGVPARSISSWMHAAAAVEKHENVFGTDFLMNQSASSLASIDTLPEKIQTAVLEDCAEEGTKLSRTELSEIRQSTPVKLMTAQDKLEAAYKKKDSAAEDWELAKSDPDCKPDSEEYNHMINCLEDSNRSIDKYQKEVDQLKADLVGEKAKAESAMKAQEKLNKEIESLKFDDTQAREQRINRISHTLTINIPQIMSDLMKFVAEETQYQDTYKEAIRQQMVQLHTYLGEHV